MKPCEFANSTYREALLFVKGYREKQKFSVMLLDATINKLTHSDPNISKYPKQISLVYDVFSNLFEEDLKQLVRERKMKPRNLKNWKN